MPCANIVKFHTLFCLLVCSFQLLSNIKETTNSTIFAIISIYFVVMEACENKQYQSLHSEQVLEERFEDMEDCLIKHFLIMLPDLKHHIHL